MSRAATSLVLILSLAAPALAAPRLLFDPNAALAQSQVTGRPVLAIAGSTGCVWCKKMAADLTTDPAVQEPAGKFVVLLLDTDDPVRWPLWSTRYKVEGEGIPAVFVVRADGEQIYGGNGAPRDLAAFLERRLEDAGTVLDDAALAELNAAARTLARSWRRRDPQEVVAELSKRLDAENYSAPARQIAAIADQMKDFVSGRLADAERDLKAADRKPEAAFEAAVTVLTLQRDYGELPGLGEELQARLAALEQDRLAGPSFERARKAVEAENLFIAGEKDEALAAMRSLADAEAPSASYARRTLSQWEKGKRAASAALAEENVADPAAPAEPLAEASSEAVKQAEAQLRLGKLLLARSPQKATKYCEKAIELAPESAAAEEARELLKP